MFGEAGDAVISCQAQVPSLAPLAHAFSKGYFGRIVIMQKQLSARLCSLVALVAAMFLACPACEKPPEAAPNAASPTKESRPSLEIRPEGPAKIGEPAIVGREADSFASYIHFPKDAATDE